MLYKKSVHYAENGSMCLVHVDVLPWAQFTCKYDIICLLSPVHGDMHPIPIKAT